MLKLGGKADSARLRNALKELFFKNAKETPFRRLTTPGGAFQDKIYWISFENGNGIWGYFDDTPYENRWHCWFGVSIGDTGNESLVPTVEINLSLSPDLRVAGYPLVDDSDGLYLGHQGLLRGGRYNVTISEFTQNIRGFVREEFEVSVDQKPRLAFVIAKVGDPDFLYRLQAYVSECARMRAEKKAEVEQNPEYLDQNGRKSKSDNATEHAFTPEASEDGTGSGKSSYDIKRLHGRVVSALKKQVPGAVNSTYNEMRPDLYTLHGDQMSVLFEVKASSDTQSWFKAIGQLLVYSGTQTPRPRLVFVCPAERKHPQFRDALKQLSIHLVIFEETKDGGIIFQRLEEAMG